MGLLVSMDDCGAQVQIGNNTWKLISAMFHSQCSRCKSVKIHGKCPVSNHDFRLRVTTVRGER